MITENTNLGTGRTGGRVATTGVIAGRYALAVGKPELPVPAGWKWTPLSDIAQLESGHTPSRKHSEYWNGDVPWIGIKDAVENHGHTIHETVQHVTTRGLANSSARLLPKNTVCLSRTASVGYVVVMGRPMATSQDFVNWVCGPQIDPQFLKYVLIAENEALWRFARGTTHQTIYYPEAKAFHICLPPLQEQRAIVQVLGTLDDKIELNQQMNKTLEAIAKAIFKHWFIDFEFPDEEGNPYKSSGGVMVYSEEIGREIPKNWKASTIGDEIEVGGGTTPDTTERSYWEGGTINWATPKDMSSLASPILTDTERKITSKGLTSIGSRKYPPGTLLMSSRAPIGYLAISDIETAVNQGMIAMICNRSLSRNFMLNWCRFNMEKVENMANGTIFKEISKSNFRLISIVLPSKMLLSHFDEVVKPLYSKISFSVKQTRTLATIRNSLLPKLMSGKIRVPVEVV